MTAKQMTTNDAKQMTTNDAKQMTTNDAKQMTGDFVHRSFSEGVSPNDHENQSDLSNF